LRVDWFDLQELPHSRQPGPRRRPLLKQQRSEPLLWLPNNMPQDFYVARQAESHPVVLFVDTVGAGYGADAESFYLEPKESKVDVWHFA
jgi:hypothetical protein